MIIVNIEIRVCERLFYFLQGMIVASTADGTRFDRLCKSLIPYHCALTSIIEAKLLSCSPIRVVNVMLEALTTSLLNFLLLLIHYVVKDLVFAGYIITKILYLILHLTNFIGKFDNINMHILFYHLFQC